MASSSPVVLSGMLNLSRTNRKYVVLAQPRTPGDVEAVYNHVFGAHGGKLHELTTVDSSVASTLGNLTLAAVENTPLLIMLTSRFGDSSPVFIPLTSIDALKDEVELQQACTFAIELTGNKGSIVLRADSSTLYNEWFNHMVFFLEQAWELQGQSDDLYLASKNGRRLSRVISWRPPPAKPAPASAAV
ncbi:uncharacterized protein BJ171DRAFT_597461 [Polychytrium aggregatum]|uniref:uncharacterized protein n=1 Tax=Polychytrium aggregatum TaxID=110093 RepID=UPI0022FE686C|nr:uncharacterized protein BJ171DRAFT_597461 [Polychytrium aggregatum]KAI9206288.1 hypothetical protein BJ171DRAFT_597461 [Polychytrium aggregatum]